MPGPRLPGAERPPGSGGGEGRRPGTGTAPLMSFGPAPLATRAGVDQAFCSTTVPALRLSSTFTVISAGW
jgi:hypothetical protein